MADRTVLLREPWHAILRRLAVRVAILLGGLAFAGIPGVWVGLVASPVLWGLGSLVALLGALFVVLSLANLVRTRRALLVLEPSGAIRRPASVQEGWLKRPVERVEGADVVVTPALSSVMGSKADPRVTLTAGGRSIADVPLWGVDVEDFVARTNALLDGDRLRYAPPQIPGD
ncbi:hypothetical protein [Demequina activiva]|uniref:Uncharacterized protein n=1 Tax=Demequina activiva TaxID=1582364 RepID=A0A919UH41_9MICO|nr:hypothetical protein [Demequina activiva]GIG55542.1 hypothetical protein Dac01nite_22940 [Demequina activiva]